MDSSITSKFYGNLDLIKNAIFYDEKYKNSPHVLEVIKEINEIVQKALAEMKAKFDTCEYDIQRNHWLKISSLAFDCIKGKVDLLDSHDQEIQRKSKDIARFPAKVVQAYKTYKKYQGIENKKEAAEFAKSNGLANYIKAKDAHATLEKKCTDVFKDFKAEFEAIIEKQPGIQQPIKQKPIEQKPVNQKPAECNKEWVALDGEGNPLKLAIGEKGELDTTGFSRDYSGSNDYNKMGLDHMFGRVKIFEIAMDVCKENRAELKQKKIGAQFKAHNQYNCKPKNQQPGYEHAHISLIPQIGIKNNDGTNIKYGCWCELNPNVSVKKLNSKNDNLISLNQILNCTDYMPKAINQIDDYIETALRDTATTLMQDVVDGKLDVNKACKFMCSEVKKALNGLKTALNDKKTEPSCTLGLRFPELYNSYKNGSQQEIDAEISGMLRAIETLGMQYNTK